MNESFHTTNDKHKAAANIFQFFFNSLVRPSNKYWPIKVEQ